MAIAPPPLSCPSCAADVAPDQDWCLACGAPARTRVAGTPNWRTPTAVLIAVILIAGGALAIAFAALTDDNGRGGAPVMAPAAAPPAAPAAPAPAPPAAATPAPAAPAPKQEKVPGSLIPPP